MNEQEKILVLKGVVTSAFTHFKKLSDQGGSLLSCEPPTPEESLEMYNNDPMIRRFTDAVVSAVFIIEEGSICRH